MPKLLAACFLFLMPKLLASAAFYEVQLAHACLDEELLCLLMPLRRDACFHMPFTKCRYSCRALCSCSWDLIKLYPPQAALAHACEQLLAHALTNSCLLMPCLALAQRILDAPLESARATLRSFPHSSKSTLLHGEAGALLCGCNGLLSHPKLMRFVPSSMLFKLHAFCAS